MSLDIYLGSTTRRPCPHCDQMMDVFDEVFEANYTHNVTAMWSKAGVYDALYMSHGHKAGEYIRALRSGVADMETNFSEYEKLNPSNGWGSAATALPWLKKALAAFEENPDATIHISK